MRLLRLPSTWSILEQLRLEEALLRHSAESWCVLSRGAAPPTVVLGLGGKAPALVDLAAARRDDVPLVRRYTGGGTVVVGEGTAFASLIVSARDAAALGGGGGGGGGVAPYPAPIMEWSAQFYAPVLARVLGGGGARFALRENDYVLELADAGARGGDAPRALKFAGNAQSITKGRWVHHTSFLWDFDDACMRYLRMPAKRPAYRADRTHGAFLTRLREHASAAALAAGPDALLDAIEAELAAVFPRLERAREADARAVVDAAGGEARWAAACRTRPLAIVADEDGGLTTDR